MSIMDNLRECRECKIVKNRSDFPRKGGRACNKCCYKLYSKNHLTPERSSYLSMVARIKKPYNPSYAHYKSRGIDIHPDWLGEGGFERFEEHIGKRPSMEHTLDRIDNDGNYEPGNVRWATRLEQANNKSNTRYLNIEGEMVPIQDVARKYNVDRTTISKRIKGGKSIPESLSPPRETAVFEYNGELMSIPQLSEKYGIYNGTLHYRLIVLGMSVDEAINKPKDERGSWKRK
jgi:hypothetical protein